MTAPRRPTAVANASTTRRENRSIITAKYTHPEVVHKEVMSDAHVVFGCVAVNYRCNTWGGSTAATAWLGVGRPRRRRTADRPCSRSTFATVFSLHGTPRACNARVSRGLPYTRRVCAKVAR